MPSSRDDDGIKPTEGEADLKDARKERESGRSKRETSNRKRSDEDSEDEERRSRRRRKERDRRSRRDKQNSSDDDEASSSGGESSRSEDDNSSSEEERRRRKRRKRRKERKRKEKKKRRKKRRRRDSDSDSSDDDDSRSSGDDDRRSKRKKRGNDVDITNNARLMAKLQAKGETLEERKQRRAARAEQKRAAFIATKFGYTAEENPFHDPNIHQAFTWKKKEEQGNQQTAESAKKGNEATTATLEEIEKLRQRRKQRELQLEEMDRIKREESRMKELENFDEWAKKEEDFHLQQQRQRSAIRLVQGREKPIDVLAKNMLLFGVDKENSAAVKYKERYNAMEELGENLEVELEEPHKLLHLLKLEELEEVKIDIDAFLQLEREAATDSTGAINDQSNSILLYWQALKTVAIDEIKLLKTSGETQQAKTLTEVQKIFQQGQSTEELEEMKVQVTDKITKHQQKASDADPSFDLEYWETVLEQLEVYLAKKALSEIHSQMLVRQLDRLEQKRAELAKLSPEERRRRESGATSNETEATSNGIMDENDEGFGGVQEENLAEEVIAKEQASSKRSYSWADKYRPRKPRYFNRVKTGYDWNKYNKTHYDRDNPPPKTVQGYKFNIFYPDLIDPSKTPKFQLTKADSDEYCIIRFSAGPPYEDVAFKIINREWNKSRKHGFKSTFERGILSLYFNFKTNWYRR